MTQIPPLMPQFYALMRQSEETVANNPPQPKRVASREAAQRGHLDHLCRVARRAWPPRSPVPLARCF